jgi:hypothetical protein
MSKFVVKDPEVFSTLSAELTKMNQEASNIVLDFNKIVEKFKEDLFKDLKETENQYSEKRSEKNQENGSSGKEPQRAGEENILWQKVESLKGAISKVGHIQIGLTQNAQKTKALQSTSSTAIRALKEFEQFSRQYLQDSLSAARNNMENNAQATTSNNQHNILKQIGDTAHFNVDKSFNLDQFSLSAIIDNADQMNRNNPSGQKATKISIGNVSQNDFSLLKKNGFTVQEIRPNSFSAYKEINHGK